VAPSSPLLILTAKSFSFRIGLEIALDVATPKNPIPTIKTMASIVMSFCNWIIGANASTVLIFDTNPQSKDGRYRHATIISSPL